MTKCTLLLIIFLSILYLLIVFMAIKLEMKKFDRIFLIIGLLIGTLSIIFRVFAYFKGNTPSGFRLSDYAWNLQLLLVIVAIIKRGLDILK